MLGSKLLPHEDVWGNSQFIANHVRKANEIQERELKAVLYVDEHIQVALWPMITARSRSEDGESGYASRAQGWFEPSQAQNDLVTTQIGYLGNH
jgi:hypothetical protein